MRDGWKKVAISDVCIMIKRGRAPSYTENKSVTVLNQKCIRDGRINLEFSRQTDANLKPINEWAYLNATDTLVNSTGVGTLGRVAFVRNLPEPTTVDSHVTIVRPDNKKVEPSFLGLSLNFREADIEGLAAGSSGQTELSREALGNLIITLPTLPEQKRIVDLISSVDTYIEALQQQLESAKRSRNAVLHELLTAGGDDWVETTIGEVVSVVNGGTPSTKSEDYWGGSIVWITTTELTAFDGKRVNSSKRTITVDGLRNGPARLVRAGTTLVGTTATIGTCALADCELTFNQQISGLIPLDKDLDDSYLFYWIQHIKYILEGLSAGTSFKRISTSVLKTVSINFPPIGEQKRIAAVISEMDEFIESIQRTSIEAKNLRSGLLSDLLSGTHEIPVTYDKAMGPA